MTGYSAERKPGVVLVVCHNAAIIVTLTQTWGLHYPEGVKCCIMSGSLHIIPQRLVMQCK